MTSSTWTGFPRAAALDGEEVTAAIHAYDPLIRYTLSPEPSAERMSAHLESLR